MKNTCISNLFKNGKHGSSFTLVTTQPYNLITFFFTTEDVIVRRNYILLKDELSVGWIHDFLLQHEVLSQRDLEDICSGLRPRHVQVDTLLKLLLRHGRSACSKLIQILPDCGYNHILDVFHETTNFKTKEGNTAIIIQNLSLFPRFFDNRHMRITTFKND